MIPDRSRSISAWMGVISLIVLCLGSSGCGEQRAGPRPAEDFTLPLLDGEGATVRLADYRGQVVYLTFWASWCLPCRQEMPYLSQLLQRHRDDGFAVLAINVDEEEDLARNFVEAYHVDLPVLLDSNREVAARYRTPGFPTHFLVDRDGNIRFSGIGFDLNDVRAVSQEVATLVAESE